MTGAESQPARPIKAEAYYPLKEVALVDSTCRAWFGFTPAGYEPGLCSGGMVGYPGSGDGDGDGDGNGNGHFIGWGVIDQAQGSNTCGANPCLLQDNSPVGAAGCLPCTLP